MIRTMFFNCNIYHFFEKYLSVKMKIAMMNTVKGIGRVLARISMPVQKSNSKISACPDLATNLLYLLTTTTPDSLLCQKGQFTL